VNRPGFNKFASGDPSEDYNRRMREYIVWLELRSKRCYRMEQDRSEVSSLASELHSSQEECESLKYSMKNLRYHLRTMFKEGNNAN
jgi:hypothetical protein